MLAAFSMNVNQAGVVQSSLKGLQAVPEATHVFFGGLHPTGGGGCSGSWFMRQAGKEQPSP